MQQLLQFLGETMFGVGIIALIVLAGVAWYLFRLRTQIQKLERRSRHQ